MQSGIQVFSRDNRTLGELIDQGIGRFRFYCENCRRIDFADAEGLVLSHGRRFHVGDISCDACGDEDIVVSPSALDRHFYMPRGALCGNASFAG